MSRDVSTKLIGEKFRAYFEELDKGIDLKLRYQLACGTTLIWMMSYKKTVPLDNFLTFRKTEVTSDEYKI